MKSSRFLIWCALISGLMGTTSATAAPERVMLDRAVIVTDSDAPSIVQYAVEDLAGYLDELTGRRPVVGSFPPRPTGVAIAVGTQSARRILAGNFPAEQLGAEGYLIRFLPKDGADFLVVAGATPQGTKAGVAALMKAIRWDGHAASLPAPLERMSRPAFAKRGMHFNGWAFQYPYSFRGWREKDWQRYLDILSYQGVNLFYLWPFMEIMPVPLSQEDQEYLEECRRVVDYAQKRHGMEVWLMQCANRVAKDRCGVADPRLRPYWRPAQVDLNPGNPADYQAIMESRGEMYRIINNADGVCNIDSDPGDYVGSPLSDYLKVFNGFRALLDQYNVHGRGTKLINWMWTGWGLPQARFFEQRHQLLTIQNMQEDLREPWGLISGRFEFLPLCREQQVLEKTVMFPYGIMEGEPAYPMTEVQLDRIRGAFNRNVIKYPELAGLMGNLQTPLLQFPHMYAYTAAMWNPGYCQRSDREALLELATHLYPEHAELIAECFLALPHADPARAETAGAKLDQLIRSNQLGRLGIFGRKLFPDPGIVARTLVLQLRLRAAQARLAQTLSDHPAATVCEKTIQNYFDAYLAWDTAHGWHSLWGWQEWPLGSGALTAELRAVAGNLGRSLGSEAEVNRCFARIGRALKSKYGEVPVREGCITPMKIAAREGLPSLALTARATASATPDPVQYPPGAANDGKLETLYWPGALVQNNTEWLQLTWAAPQTFDRVVVRFLQHRSLRGRTIHLQKENAPGRWDDLATTTIAKEPAAPHAVATFQLPAHVTTDKIRVLNLIDLFEIEVR